MKKWFLSVAALGLLGLGTTLEAEAVSIYGWDGSVSYRDSNGMHLDVEMKYTNPATVQVIFVDEHGVKLPFTNADMVKVVGNVGDTYDLNGPHLSATPIFGSANGGWYDAMHEGESDDAIIPEGGKIIYKKFKLRDSLDVAKKGDYGWSFESHNGCWVYLDENAYYKTGWIAINGQWYYLGEDFEDGYNYNMRIGWQFIDGAWYYFNSSGVMQTGWQVIGGAWYYFNPSGTMLNGWQVIDGSWYYFNPSGAMLNGWQVIDGFWYYFNSSGVMQTGNLEIDGVWYNFAGSGEMQ